jgi:hypothetical protein
MTVPRIIAAVSGAGFVLERTESDNFRTVVPLAAWGITEQGDTLPLPLSLGSEWTVRPQTSEDDRFMRLAARRAQLPPPPVGFGPDVFSRS